MTSEKLERRAESTKTKGARKPYVKKACVNCKNAHAACDEGRPCRRCVAMGMEHSCIDAERKKPTPKSDKLQNESDFLDELEEGSSSTDRLRTLKLQQSKAAKNSPISKQKSRKSASTPDANNKLVGYPTTTSTSINNNNSNNNNIFGLPNTIPPVNFNNLFSLFPAPIPPSSATIIPPDSTEANPKKRKISAITSDSLQQPQQPLHPSPTVLFPFVPLLGPTTTTTAPLVPTVSSSIPTTTQPLFMPAATPNVIALPHQPYPSNTVDSTVLSPLTEIISSVNNNNDTTSNNNNNNNNNTNSSTTDYDILLDDPIHNLSPLSSEKIQQSEPISIQTNNNSKHNSSTDDIDLYMDLSALPSSPTNSSNSNSNNIIAIPPSSTAQNAFEFAHPPSPSLFSSSPINSFFSNSIFDSNNSITNNHPIVEEAKENQKPSDVNRMLHILNQLSNLSNNSNNSGNMNNTTSNTQTMSNTNPMMITNANEDLTHHRDLYSSSSHHYNSSQNLEEIHNAQNLIENSDEQLKEGFIDLVTKQASELQASNTNMQHTIESPTPFEDAVVQYLRPNNTNSSVNGKRKYNSGNGGNAVVRFNTSNAQELTRNKKITIDDLLNQMIVEKQNHVRQLEEIKQKHEQVMNHQTKRIDELEKQQSEMMKLISELQKLVISNLNAFSTNK